MTAKPISVRQIEVEILQVLDQILQGLTLRPAILKLLQVPEPPVAVLPVDRLNRVHGKPRKTSRHGLPTMQGDRVGRVKGQPQPHPQWRTVLAAERLPSADRSRQILNPAGRHRDSAARLCSTCLVSWSHHVFRLFLTTAFASRMKSWIFDSIVPHPTLEGRAKM